MRGKLCICAWAVGINGISPHKSGGVCHILRKVLVSTNHIWVTEFGDFWLFPRGRLRRPDQKPSEDRAQMGHRKPGPAGHGAFGGQANWAPLHEASGCGFFASRRDVWTTGCHPETCLRVLSLRDKTRANKFAGGTQNILSTWLRPTVALGSCQRPTSRCSRGSWHLICS